MDFRPHVDASRDLSSSRQNVATYSKALSPLVVIKTKNKIMDLFLTATFRYCNQVSPISPQIHLVQM
jgi:hypothetical protein